MREDLLHLLRCPVSRSKLTIRNISQHNVGQETGKKNAFENAVLFAEQDWIYPVIDGIPRMQVEAFLDYKAFLEKNFAGYRECKMNLLQKYPDLINYVVRKNRRTKESFESEWKIFDYVKDRTWNAGPELMLKRFCKEIGEPVEFLQGKLILDAGCGNGLLDSLVAEEGATVVGMDISRSVERAKLNNDQAGVSFVQGDVQFPPFASESFDVVHCSGVLIHTNNTESSFRSIETCVKPGGKLSVWLYHPRKDIIHNLINSVRRVTSRLPVRVQYYLYLVIFFPITYLLKRIKGNKQPPREMLIEIMDSLSPEFRWEHGHEEAARWFKNCTYQDVLITADETFGFNIIGVKEKQHLNKRRDGIDYKEK